MGLNEVSLFRVRAVWHYRFRLDGNQVRRSTRETSQAAARRVAQDAFQAAKLRSRGEEPEPTLGSLVDLWVAAHSKIRSRSALDTVERFGRLHAQTLKSLPLRQLSTVAVEDARLEFLQSHASSSGNLWLATLRSLIGWAIRRKMLRQVPWDIRKLKVQRKPKRLLPVEKAQAWLTAVDEAAAEDPGLALVIRLQLGLGLRVSEALGARWEWLDWERKTYTPGETKGREAWPRPVPEWCLGILEAFRQGEGRVILPVRQDHPITDQRVRGVMAKANRAVGVGHLTPHRLRGTYATLLAEAGVPIQDIQRALGHKDIRTTIGYLETCMDRVVLGQIILAQRLGMPEHKSGHSTNQDPLQTSPRELSRVIHGGGER